MHIPCPLAVSCRRQTMSALAAAFAESGHGILAGMSTRPRSPVGDPMTLGNMRAAMRSLDVSCWQCHHRTIMSADPWPRSRAGAEAVATPFSNTQPDW
jgi:hypothetical protein